MRHEEDIRLGALRDVLELCFAKVCDDPPFACVDHCKDLRAGMDLGAHRRGQVGNVAVERRVYPAVVQIVLRGADRGGALFPLSA